MRVEDHLDFCVAMAFSHWDRDPKKNHSLAAFGKRKDGAGVCSYNGSSMEKTLKTHAEYRICGKLDKGSTVFVGRASRLGMWAMAKPCPSCRSMLRAYGVKKVYYTISPGEYGVMRP